MDFGVLTGGQFLIHSAEEYLVVTRKINIFALYNVNKHSMPRQKREKSGTGICHVLKGKESNCPYDFLCVPVIYRESWSRFLKSFYLDNDLAD